jgi:hypothetical protein
VANKFQIIIEANDRATRQLNKVNDQLSRFVRPFKELHRSTQAFAKASGLTSIGNQLERVTRAGGRMVEQLRSAAAPLLAIVGGGTLAGLVAFTNQWGVLGFNVGQTAQNLAVSTSHLQEMRGAAKLAGIETSVLDAGLQSLGDTMEDALYGRNQAALLMLNRLGIGIHKTATGAIDVERGFTDMARALSRAASPEVQRLIARQFGLEGLLPLLRRGPAGLRELTQEARRLGYVMDGNALKAADNFAMKMRELEVAGEGARNALGERLFPILIVGLNELTRWLESGGLDRFINKANQVADAFGGWRRVLVGLGILMGANLLAPVLQLALGFGGLAKSILLASGRLLALLGMAAGAPTALSGLLSSLGVIGAGVGGWMLGTWIYDNWIADRLSFGANGHAPVGIRQNNPLNLRKWGGMPVANGFAQFPSVTAGISAGARQLELYGQSGINTLSGIINKWAPSGDGNNVPAYIADVSQRTGFGANQVLNLEDEGTLTRLVSAMIQHESGQNPYSGAFIGNAVHQALEVHIHGAAPGTRVTARTSDGSRVPVRVNQTLHAVAAP